jgi:hypothetical protein
MDVFKHLKESTAVYKNVVAIDAKCHYGIRQKGSR